jgi:phytoene dehydrogenase-like protein
VEPDRPVSVDRRAFVAGAVGAAALGAAALVGLTRKAGRPLAGALMDDGHAAGHLLRDGGAAPAVRRRERRSVVIVGGGVAGLSAAWWLARHGMRDFVLLELADRPGGNSRWGENAVSAFPWGAHYVPVPGPRATLVRELFAEMGLLGSDGAWSERDLCFAPKERTFVHGRWREGLVDALALDASAEDELRRFDARIDALRAGGAFTIPLALGAAEHDVASSPLDAMTAEAWLAREGFRSEAIRWYVDYACRDDFGTRARDASAWAALHYFAAREDDDPGPLTWPEGNGRLVRHLAGRVAEHVVPNAPVRRVERSGTRMRVLAGDAEWTCDTVIWAAPTFLARYVVEGAPAVPWRYAPWLVANLTLDRRPAAADDDASEAWDNVIVDSPGLGYVVATHQALRAAPEARTVWTYYRALADGDPAEQRRRLLATDWRACAELALSDLERAHPDIRECVARVDVIHHGHAMPRPEPGFLAQRRAWWAPTPGARVLYANSDVSGLSLFEEAQYRGVRAAEGAMARV